MRGWSKVRILPIGHQGWMIVSKNDSTMAKQCFGKVTLDSCTASYSLALVFLQGSSTNCLVPIFSCSQFIHFHHGAGFYKPTNPQYPPSHNHGLLVMETDWSGVQIPVRDMWYKISEDSFTLKKWEEIKVAKWGTSKQYLEIEWTQ